MAFYKFLNEEYVQALTVLELIMDIVKMDPLAFRKISKRHFLRDIEKSFQEITPMGPEPHQFFFLFKISQQIWWLEAPKILAKWAVADGLIEQRPK